MSVIAIGAQIGLVVAGSILFQGVLAVTLSVGVDPNLLKLVTASFVLVIVAIPRLTNKTSLR
jgi:putative ABC transport system permease protein